MVYPSRSRSAAQSKVVKDASTEVARSAKVRRLPSGKSAPVSDKFSPVTTPLRAFEQVCAQIRGLIADGILKPGDKLPAERDFAESLQVSRGVVREALRTLEIAGLIDLRKGGAGGAFVVTAQFRIVTQAFKDMVYLGSVSLAEIIEARQQLVSNAIELACARGTEEDFDAIERNINQTEEIRQLPADENSHRRMQLSAEFYHLLGIATKNQVIVVMLDTVSEMLLRFFEPGTTNRPVLQLVASRRRFLAFLRARNVAKATKEMSTFLAALQNYMLVMGAGPVVKRRRVSR